MTQQENGSQWKATLWSYNILLRGNVFTHKPQANDGSFDPSTARWSFSCCTAVTIITFNFEIFSVALVGTYLLFYKYFCLSFFSIASFMDGVLLITQDQHWSRKIPVIQLKIRWFTQKITTQVKCFLLPVPNQNLKMTESLFQSHLMGKRSNPIWYSLMP